MARLGLGLGTTANPGAGGGDRGLTGWSVQSGSGSISSSSGNLLLATTGQAAVTFERPWARPLAKGDAIVIRLKRGANLSALDLRIVKGGSTTSIANVNAAGTNNGLVVGRSSKVVVPISRFSVNLATLGPASHLRIIVTPTSGNDTVLEIEDVRWVSTDATPRVCFQFDDGSASTYATAYPILAANGYAGTIAIDCTNIGNSGYMTEGQVAEVYAANWELLAHHTTQMTTLSDADALTQLTLAQDWLDTRLYTRGRDHFVWPGGWRNEAKDAIAATLFRTRRGINPAMNMVAKGHYDPYDISTLYIVKGTSAATVKAYGDRVVDRGGTVNLAFHNIVETEVANEDWSIAKFTETVEYFASLGLTRTTYDEMFP